MLRTWIPLTCLLALVAAACGSPDTTTVKGLMSVDERVGTGAEATFGRSVLVHYTGWIHDANRDRQRGRQFDSSRDRNQPLPFTLGAGQVIRGWDEGVNGMKVGGRRTLTIPPDMAYGEEGLGALIPPNATLVFDVELIDVK